MFIVYSTIPPVLQDMKAEMPIDCMCHKLILTIESVAYTMYHGPIIWSVLPTVLYNTSVTQFKSNYLIAFHCCTVDLYINNIVN